MALSLVLRSCTAAFLPGGGTHAEVVIDIVDDALGVVGQRTVTVSEPTIIAGIRDAALGLAPATSAEVGNLPLALPQ